MFCQKLGYVVRATRVFEVWAPLEVWTGGVSPFLPTYLVQCDSAIFQLLVLISSVSRGNIWEDTKPLYLIPSLMKGPEGGPAMALGT